MAKDKPKPPPFTITTVDDFDGDGVVIRADIVKYQIAPVSCVRLTFNSGSHQTTVELSPDDFENMGWLIRKAEKAMVKLLVKAK